MPFYGISENGANIQLDQYGYSSILRIDCRAMDGFHRIRHYGLLASGVRKTRLAKIHSLLCVQPTEQAAARAAEPEVASLTLREPCPCCGGPMRIIEIFRRGQKPMSRAPPREQAA